MTSLREFLIYAAAIWGSVAVVSAAWLLWMTGHARIEPADLGDFDTCAAQACAVTLPDEAFQAWADEIECERIWGVS